MKKNRASNHKQNEIGVLPFPPLPVQVNTSPQSQSTNRAPLMIGAIAGIGLIALLIYVVPWSSVSQTLTGSFDSLSTQVKQVQFAQVKHPKKAGVPPETSTPATSTVETAPESATSAPATSAVETTPTSAASEPDTPRVETSSTPEVPAPVTPAAETSPAPEVSTPATPQSKPRQQLLFPHRIRSSLLGDIQCGNTLILKIQSPKAIHSIISFGFMKIGFFRKDIEIGKHWRDTTAYAHPSTR